MVYFLVEKCVLMSVIKHERNSLGDLRRFWGRGLSVSTYFGYGAFRENRGAGSSLWPVPDGHSL